ncbi:DUF6318 family protein [Xylanimonas ulmi]|uniref:DUF6318 family protein n=1 Tax=Xylanimonas ulmi TaxID=228973 RepID=UPI00102C39DD|nr:DUF6318 family protein [Xylanibacterium ulmi]
MTDSPPEPSPTPSRVVVKPERPAAMDDDGPAGAEAAAVYFVKLDSYTQATGDTAEWEAMSHEVCGFCAGRLAQAQRIAERGDAFVGGELCAEVRHTYRMDLPTGIWPIDLDIAESPTRIIRPDGTVAFETGESRYVKRVEVARRHGAWVVFTVGSIPES